MGTTRTGLTSLGCAIALGCGGSVAASGAGGAGGSFLGTAGAGGAGTIPSFGGTAQGGSSISSGGAAHIPVCPNPPLVAIDPLMLADFEDGTAPGWSYSNDTQGTQFGTGVEPLAYALDVSRGDSTYAAHSWGVGHPQWAYISFGFSPCVDVSSVDGIAFWARGDVTLHFTAVTPETNAIEAGGDCASSCYDSYGDIITLTPDWRLYAYRWDELAQVGWGAAVPFSRHVEFYAWGTAGTRTETMPFDFWIDDVTYFVGAKPGAGAAAGAGGSAP